MRLWRRRDTGQVLELTPAARPPVELACLAFAFGLAAALVVSGVDLPFGPLAVLLPLAAAIALAWVVGRLRGERSVEVIDGLDGRELRYRRGRDAERVVLAELSSVSREPEGEPPVLTLTDLRGATVAVPLGVWTDELRLLDEVDSAATAAGASGVAGLPVDVRRPGWVVPARIALAAVAFASAVVLVGGIPDEEPVERVTPERIAASAGSTQSPFAGSLPCTVYVVPLDRASQEHANEISRRLAMGLPVQPCAVSSSLALDTRALDLERGQLDASALTGGLRDLFVAEHGERTSTVVGVTEHDLYSSASPEDRFAFGFSLRDDEHRRGFSVISTARMGSGDDLARRLQTMAVRYVGLGYFGLELGRERASALYETIRSRSDLDRMSPQLGDPPLTESELRQARARFLAGT